MTYLLSTNVTLTTHSQSFAISMLPANIEQQRTNVSTWRQHTRKAIKTLRAKSLMLVVILQDFEPIDTIRSGEKTSKLQLESSTEIF
jgi:hypothetical protein